jgi:hypothetical protein
MTPKNAARPHDIDAEGEIWQGLSDALNAENSPENGARAFRIAREWEQSVQMPGNEHKFMRRHDAEEDSLRELEREIRNAMCGGAKGEFDRGAEKSIGISASRRRLV